MFRTLPLISRLFPKVFLHELQTITSLLHEYLSMVGSAAYMGIVFYEQWNSKQPQILLWQAQFSKWNLLFIELKGNSAHTGTALNEGLRQKCF